MDPQPQQSKPERLIRAPDRLGHFDLPTMRAGRVKIRVGELPDGGEAYGSDHPAAHEPGGARVVAEGK